MNDDFGSQELALLDRITSVLEGVEGIKDIRQIYQAIPDELFDTLEKNGQELCSTSSIEDYKLHGNQLSSLFNFVQRKKKEFPEFTGLNERHERIQGLMTQFSKNLEESIHSSLRRSESLIESTKHAPSQEAYTEQEQGLLNTLGQTESLLDLTQRCGFLSPESTSDISQQLRNVKEKKAINTDLHLEIQNLVEKTISIPWWETPGKNYNKEARRLHRAVAGNWFTRIFVTPLLKRCKKQDFSYGERMCTTLINDLNHLRRDGKGEQPKYDRIKKEIDVKVDLLGKDTDGVSTFDLQTVENKENAYETFGKPLESLLSLYLKPSISKFFSAYHLFRTTLKDRKQVLQGEMERLLAERGIRGEGFEHRVIVQPAIVEKLEITIDDGSRQRDFFCFQSYIQNLGFPKHDILFKIRRTLMGATTEKAETLMERLKIVKPLVDSLEPFTKKEDFEYIQHLLHAFSQASQRGALQTSKLSHEQYRVVEDIYTTLYNISSQSASRLNLSLEEVEKYQALYGINRYDFPLVRVA